MAELSKEEKKALMNKWKAFQNKKYILSKAKTQKLFRYLEIQSENTSCNHMLCHSSKGGTAVFWIGKKSCNAGWEQKTWRTCYVSISCVKWI